jgi:hypothetical protein
MKQYLLLIYSLLLALLIFTTACAPSYSSQVTETTVIAESCNFISCENRPGVYNVELIRYYNPSQIIQKDVYVPSWVFSVRIPSEVTVASGNAGTGWLSIRTGTERYCYQGNASNNSTPNGTKFVLKKKTLGNACNGTGMTISGQQDLVGLSKTIVTMAIDGGGCSGSACSTTIVNMSLEAN